MPRTTNPLVSTIQSQRAAGLEVRREDVRFWNITPQLIRVEITVRNLGHETSRPTEARVEIAPFGAFLPWKPLARLPVPPIRAGGKHTLSLEAPPLADGGPPPSLLATATGAGDADDGTADENGLHPFPGAFQRLGRTGLGRSRPLFAARTSMLMNTLMDMLTEVTHKGAHWAGNINVFIGSQPVERHLAQAVRIYPGMTNYALFIVGDAPDAFAFEPRTADELWTVAIRSSLGHETVTPGAWIEQEMSTMYGIEMCVPEQATEGKVDIHVRCRSTGEETVVEFSLAADALGPGCHVF